MWYPLQDATTHLYPSVDRGRTADPPGGLTVIQCVCVAPLPDPAGQCPGPDRPCDCRHTGLRRSDGPQCPACLQYPRRGRPAAALLGPAAAPPCGLRCTAPRAVTCLLAPEAAPLWPPHPPVDIGVGGHDGGCRGPHASAPPWRRHAPGAGTPRRPLAARPTLDDQPLSRVQPKKNGAPGGWRALSPIPRGAAAVGTQSGGGAWRRPRCIPGPWTRRPGAWEHQHGLKPLSSRQRGPGMACGGVTAPRRPPRGGGALWRVARSARRPRRCGPGAVRAWQRKGSRRGGGAGITPRGPSATRCGRGCGRTLASGSRPGRAGASWRAVCQAQAPGCIPWSPHGCRGTGRSSHRIGCSVRRRSWSAFILLMDVRRKRIRAFPKKLRDPALGYSSSTMTLDIYSHISLDLEKQAAAKLAAALTADCSRVAVK
jgi:hypothetical protein